MSESAGPLLSRRAALIAGTVATGTVWIAPLAASVSMTTAHAASGAPDSVKPPSQKGTGRGSRRPKAPGNNNGNAKVPGSRTGNPKAPSHNYGDLRASGSNRGGNGHNTQRLDHRKGSRSTQWFGRVWVWIKSWF